jgi:hypothetical protein
VPGQELGVRQHKRGEVDRELDVWTPRPRTSDPVPLKLMERIRWTRRPRDVPESQRAHGVLPWSLKPAVCRFRSYSVCVTLRKSPDGRIIRRQQRSRKSPMARLAASRICVQG